MALAALGGTTGALKAQAGNTGQLAEATLTRVAGGKDKTAHGHGSDGTASTLSPGRALSPGARTDQECIAARRTIAGFYHVTTKGKWEAIVQEQLVKWRMYGLKEASSALHVTVVVPPEVNIGPLKMMSFDFFSI